MKRVSWLITLLLASLLPMFVQAQHIKNVREYEDYMRIYNERDLVNRAALAERFLIEHASSDLEVRTRVWMMMFRAYADVSNWAKTLDTFERINIAPKLTEQQKVQFSEMAATARQRLRQ